MRWGGATRHASCTAKTQGRLQLPCTEHVTDLDLRRPQLPFLHVRVKGLMKCAQHKRAYLNANFTKSSVVHIILTVTYGIVSAKGSIKKFPVRAIEM